MIVWLELAVEDKPLDTFPVVSCTLTQTVYSADLDSEAMYRGPSTRPNHSQTQSPSCSPLERVLQPRGPRLLEWIPAKFIREGTQTGQVTGRDVLNIFFQDLGQDLEMSIVPAPRASPAQEYTSYRLFAGIRAVFFSAKYGRRVTRP